MHMCATLFHLLVVVSSSVVQTLGVESLTYDKTRCDSINWTLCYRCCSETGSLLGFFPAPKCRHPSEDDKRKQQRLVVAAEDKNVKRMRNVKKQSKPWLLLNRSCSLMNPGHTNIQDALQAEGGSYLLVSRCKWYTGHWAWEEAWMFYKMEVGKYCTQLMSWVTCKNCPGWCTGLSILSLSSDVSLTIGRDTRPLSSLGLDTNKARSGLENDRGLGYNSCVSIQEVRPTF